jgi:phosphate:Na+ symporter
MFPIAIRFLSGLIAAKTGFNPLEIHIENMAEDKFEQVITAGIALTHTTFNVINVLIFLPFAGLLAKLVTKLVPDRGAEEVPHLTYLDVRMLDTPALGIVQSGRQIQFMGESIELMLEKLGTVLESDTIDDALEAKIFKREEILDNVQKEIMIFLGELISGQVPYEVMETSRHQMRMADEYESVSDYAASVLKGIRKLRDNNLQLAPEGIQEFIDLNRRVLEYVRQINRTVVNEDARAAGELVARSGEITRTMKKYRQQHLARLADNKVSALSSLVYTDILNNYRRMKDHALNIAEVIVGEK